jgi:hypothetical protein
MNRQAKGNVMESKITDGKKSEKKIDTKPTEVDKTESITLSLSSVSIPLSTLVSNTYISRSLSLKLEHKHAVMLSRIVSGLAARGAVTLSGRPVRSTQQAMVWVLEQIEQNATANEI